MNAISIRSPRSTESLRSLTAPQREAPHAAADVVEVSAQPTPSLTRRLLRSSHLVALAAAASLMCATGAFAQSTNVVQTPQPTPTVQVEQHAKGVGVAIGRVGGFFKNAGQSLGEGARNGYNDTQGKASPAPNTPPTQADRGAAGIGSKLGHIGGFFKNVGVNIGHGVRDGFKSTQQH